MANTAVERQPRSPELKRVDAALQAYERSNNRVRRRNLQTALQAWKFSKPGDWRASARNRLGAVAKLETEIQLLEGITVEPDEQLFPGHARYPGAAWAAAKRTFVDNTERDLTRIAETQVGAELLKLIAQRHRGVGTKNAPKTVTIIFRPATNHSAASPGPGTGAMVPNARFNVTNTRGGRNFVSAGRGSDSKIRMHNGPNSDQIYSGLSGIHTPAWIVLAHELIHALHHLSGTAYEEVINVPGQGDVRREEIWTTGLGVYANTRISENKFRAEVGLPQRTHYEFAGDCWHVNSLTG
jgi:hypothetical protein